MTQSFTAAPHPAESGGSIAAPTYLGLFAFTLVVHGIWILATDPPTGFADSDGYMRALRVEALWQGGGWFDGSIPRANAPYGDTLHWTRPLDVLISLLALPLAPFFGFKLAIFWGGALSGPVLHGAAVAVLAWAALPLVGRTAAVLAAIAGTVQFGLISYGAINRADHHIFYVFLAALGFGWAIRALDRNRGADRDAMYAGLAAAMGVWIGIEGFVFALLSLAALGLPWLAGEDSSAASKAVRFAAGLAMGLAGALAIESGPSYFAVVHDRISIVHVTLTALIAAFFLAVTSGAIRGWLPTPLARFVALLTGAGATAAVWVLLFPKALDGPLADVDPAYARFVLGSIAELGPGYTLERFSALLGVAILSLPWLFWRVRREKSGRWFWAWVYVGVCVAIFAALTAGWMRWTIYAGLFSCLALGDMIAHALARIAEQNISPVLREASSAAAVAIILIGPPAVGYATALVVVPPEKRAERELDKSCAGRLLTAALSRAPWSDRPRTILAGVNYGAEILYRTPHRVVGTPYHRAQRAMTDTFAAFAATDDAVVREILTRRGVELIAICPQGGGEGLTENSRRADGFYDRLKNGVLPEGIRDVAMPGEAGAFRLFQVR